MPPGALLDKARPYLRFRHPNCLVVGVEIASCRSPSESSLIAFAFFALNLLMTGRRIRVGDPVLVPRVL